MLNILQAIAEEAAALSSKVEGFDRDIKKIVSYIEED